MNYLTHKTQLASLTRFGEPVDFYLNLLHYVCQCSSGDPNTWVSFYNNLGPILHLRGAHRGSNVLRDRNTVFTDISQSPIPWHCLQKVQVITTVSWIVSSS